MIDRCNLTVALEPGQEDLVEFLAEQEVEVVASLPALNRGQTDSQRGADVFDRSIEVLRHLNRVGYGNPGSGLILNLVSNPGGAFLPGDQVELNRQWRQRLAAEYEIHFNELLTITNMPVGRFLAWLNVKGQIKPYMQKLLAAWNPVAATRVMCRDTLSVDWRGRLYDCDFNQMLELGIAGEGHISNVTQEDLRGRKIVTGMHCFGCTAGCGSSCGGALDT